MTSETDLSTADLAQPGGARQPDRGDDDQRESQPAADATGERTYETSGNRVQDPSDEDTVEMGGGGTAGSTRNDVLRGDAPSAGADRDAGDRDMTDRDMAGQGMGGQNMADRDMADRDMGARRMGDRRMGGQGMGDRDMTDGDMGGQGMGDRDAGGGGMAERGPGAGDTRGDVALLDVTDAEGFRRRWSDTQARFVDDPREAVQTADGLVAELMQTLASSFSQHKGELEAHWNSGGDPDTEDLRQALQRYRSFFDRLLSA